jgi:small subunit ribosomal protein S10
MSVKTQRMRIKLEGFYHEVVDESTGMIVDMLRKKGETIRGPVPLPTKISKYTVLRGPHIDKKSREQFEIRKHARVVDIIDVSQETVKVLMNLDLPASDVGVKVKVY